MIAGSDIENGCANSLTDIPRVPSSRASNARLVGSARAAKVRSRTASLYLTIRFSIDPNPDFVKARRMFFALGTDGESRGAHVDRPCPPPLGSGHNNRAHQWLSNFTLKF